MNVPQDIIATIIFLITFALFFSFWLNIALSYKMRDLYQRNKELHDKVYLTNEDLIRLELEHTNSKTGETNNEQQERTLRTQN
tara:strand:- start:2773 stop:3021 length:249 start_codon:yes stop_codon:yes gene_type:complete